MFEVVSQVVAALDLGDNGVLVKSRAPLKAALGIYAQVLKECLVATPNHSPYVALPYPHEVIEQLWCMVLRNPPPRKRDEDFYYYGPFPLHNYEVLRVIRVLRAVYRRAKNTHYPWVIIESTVRVPSLLQARLESTPLFGGGGDRSQIGPRPRHRPCRLYSLEEGGEAEGGSPLVF